MNKGTKPPVHRLKKYEIVWLNNNFCRHGHTYLSHYPCYLKENPDRKERIGFFDIETFTSSFKADRGLMLSYCIKERRKKKVYGRLISKKDVLAQDDSTVVKACVEDMKKFDRLVTYYGTNFDNKFVRTRAMFNNIAFPEYASISHTDLFYLIKSKFSMRPSSLENACRVLLGKSNKTHFDWWWWLAAAQGDISALKEIYQHNIYDVEDLEKLYEKVIIFKKETDLSI